MSAPNGHQRDLESLEQNKFRMTGNAVVPQMNSISGSFLFLTTSMVHAVVADWCCLSFFARRIQRSKLMRMMGAASHATMAGIFVRTSVTGEAKSPVLNTRFSRWWMPPWQASSSGPTWPGRLHFWGIEGFPLKVGKKSHYSIIQSQKQYWLYKKPAMFCHLTELI